MLTTAVAKLILLFFFILLEPSMTKTCSMCMNAHALFRFRSAPKADAWTVRALEMHAFCIQPTNIVFIYPRVPPNSIYKSTTAFLASFVAAQ